MKHITALPSQSLLDIALQHCGSVDAAYDIALLNNLSVTDPLEPGTQLALPEPTAADVVRRYTADGISPATFDAADGATGAGSIGSWTIGHDFRVS